MVLSPHLIKIRRNIVICVIIFSELSLNKLGLLTRSAIKTTNPYLCVLIIHVSCYICWCFLMFTLKFKTQINIIFTWTVYINLRYNILVGI